MFPPLKKEFKVRLRKNVCFFLNGAPIKLRGLRSSSPGVNITKLFPSSLMVEENWRPSLFLAGYSYNGERGNRPILK
jgi:hypothetical protein